MAVLTSRLRQFIIEDSGVNISVTYDAFTPSANSLLVVVFGGCNLDGRIDLGGLTLSGGGLTWTKQLQTGTFGGDGYAQTCEVWTAPVGASPPSVALQIAGSIASGEDPCRLHVNAFDVTGYNTASPIGTTKIVNGDGSETGTYTLTLDAAPASDSIVIAFRFSTPNTATTTEATPGTGWTELYDFGTGTGGYGDLQTQSRTGSTSTSVTWNDAVTAGGYSVTSIQFGAIELNAASGSSLTATATGEISAPTASVGAVSGASLSAGVSAGIPALGANASALLGAGLSGATSAQLSAPTATAVGSSGAALAAAASASLSAPTASASATADSQVLICSMPSVARRGALRAQNPSNKGDLSVRQSLYAQNSFGVPTDSCTSAPVTTVDGSVLLCHVNMWFPNPDEYRVIEDSKANYWHTIEHPWAPSDEFPTSRSILYQATTNYRGASHTFTKKYYFGSETTFSIIELLGVTGMREILHSSYSAGYGTVFASQNITVPSRAVLLCFLELNWSVTADTVPSAGWTLLHEYRAPDDNSIHTAVFARVVDAGTYSCTLTITGVDQGGGVTIASFVGDYPSIGGVVPSVRGRSTVGVPSVLAGVFPVAVADAALSAPAGSAVASSGTALGGTVAAALAAPSVGVVASSGLALSGASTASLVAPVGSAVASIGATVSATALATVPALSVTASGLSGAALSASATSDLGAPAGTAVGVSGAALVASSSAALVAPGVAAVGQSGASTTASVSASLAALEAQAYGGLGNVLVAVTTAALTAPTGSVAGLSGAALTGAATASLAAPQVLAVAALGDSASASVTAGFEAPLGAAVGTIGNFLAASVSAEFSSPLAQADAVLGAEAVAAVVVSFDSPTALVTGFVPLTAVANASFAAIAASAFAVIGTPTEAIVSAAFLAPLVSVTAALGAVVVPRRSRKLIEPYFWRAKV